MSHTNFCKEISALEDIAGELGQEESSEEVPAKARLLMVVKDSLNAKLMEMEEYYMKRIELYRERSRMEIMRLEAQMNEHSGKYLDLLTRVKKLGDRIEELEIKNAFYKSRMNR